MFGTSRGPRNSATIRALGAAPVVPVEFAIGDKVTHMKPGPRRNASGAVRSRANREANPVSAVGLIISVEPVPAAERVYGVLDEDDHTQFNNASELTLVSRAEDTTDVEKARVHNYITQIEQGQSEAQPNDPTNVSGGKRSKSRRNRKTKKSRKGSRRH
jgi:hypothetical protein